MVKIIFSSCSGSKPNDWEQGSKKAHSGFALQSYKYRNPPTAAKLSLAFASHLLSHQQQEKKTVIRQPHTLHQQARQERASRSLPSQRAPTSEPLSRE